MKTRRERKIDARLNRLRESGRPIRALRRAEWAVQGHNRPVWVGERINSHNRMYLPYQRSKYGQWSRGREHTETKIRSVISGLPQFTHTIRLAAHMIVKPIRMQRKQAR